MASFTSAHDLRKLLSVAAKLRRLANDTLAPSDRELYLLAADALEKRAGWLSGTLPDVRYEIAPEQMPHLHRPVNLVV